MDAHLALLLLRHHDVHHEQELAHMGQELGLVENSSYLGEDEMRCGRQWGSGGCLHGSPSAESPLMHAARVRLWAWEQAVGLIVPGFRGVSCDVAWQ